MVLWSALRSQETYKVLRTVNPFTIYYNPVRLDTVIEKNYQSILTWIENRKTPGQTLVSTIYHGRYLSLWMAVLSALWSVRICFIPTWPYSQMDVNNDPLERTKLCCHEFGMWHEMKKGLICKLQRTIFPFIRDQMCPLSQVISSGFYLPFFLVLPHLAHPQREKPTTLITSRSSQIGQTGSSSGLTLVTLRSKSSCGLLIIKLCEG